MIIGIAKGGIGWTKARYFTKFHGEVGGGVPGGWYSGRESGWCRFSTSRLSDGHLFRAKNQKRSDQPRSEVQCRSRC